MGHYASEIEETPEQEARNKERREKEVRDLEKSRAFIEMDIERRGVASVLADILASPQNYRDQALFHVIGHRSGE